jgi:hypothetical protein
VVILEPCCFLEEILFRTGVLDSFLPKLSVGFAKYKTKVFGGEGGGVENMVLCFVQNFFFGQHES